MLRRMRSRMPIRADRSVDWRPWHNIEPCRFVSVLGFILIERPVDSAHIFAFRDPRRPAACAFSLSVALLACRRRCLYSPL